MCGRRSHIWSTGQDQCAIIKRQLQLLLPGVIVFLDVDDLGTPRPEALHHTLQLDDAISLLPHRPPLCVQRTLATYTAMFVRQV